MKKYLTLCGIVVFIFATLSACAPDLHERALISAVGIDRTENGCRVTVRAALADGNGTEISLSGVGETVPQALNEIVRSTGQQPLYSHNTLIVFGMDCARNGLGADLDFFIRHYDSRPTIQVFLSETTAEDILRVEGDADPRATQIAEITNGADYSGLSVDVNLIGLINGTYGEGASAVLPVLRRTEQIEPAGTALLRDFTLQKLLSPQDVQGLLILQGNLKAGQFVVEDPACGAVTLAVNRTKSEIQFTGTEENPRFAVNVQIEGEISAISSARYPIGNEAFPRLEKALAEQAVSAIEAYLSAAVYESGSDAAGFGAAVLRDAPEVWRSICDNWALIQQNAVFDIQVESAIDRVEEENVPYF